MLHSLKTVLDRIPNHNERYDLIFEFGSGPIVQSYEDIEWKDIENKIFAVCHSSVRYQVVTILHDLDLRYFLHIKLREADEDDI